MKKLLLFFFPFSTTSQVIGDKTAWLTSGIFRNIPHDTVTGVIDEIEKQYRVKTKFIHLIRNPFDIISTITLRHNNRRFGNHSDKVRNGFSLPESSQDNHLIDVSRVTS